MILIFAAVSYVAVIENPTPRWTPYDSEFFGVELPEGTLMQLHIFLSDSIEG